MQIRLREDIRVIQLTANSYDEIVDLLGDKFMGYRTNPIQDKGSIMFIDDTMSCIFGEILEGDYILVSNTNEILMLLDEDYFNKIFSKVL